MSKKSPDGFRLILVEVVRAPLPDVLSSRLLQLANLWLRRRAAGWDDRLYLVGLGFDNEDAFRNALQPYGLDDAATTVLDASEDDSDVSVEVGLEVSRWVRRHHDAALPLASWPRGLDGIAYPADVWWMGLEAAGESSDWEDCIKAAVPQSFADQAATWALLFDKTQGHDEAWDMRDGLLAGLSAAAFAMWLVGFSAASENTFFDFSYAEVPRDFGLDPVVLILEGAERCPEAVGVWLHAESSTDALGSATKALLRTHQDFDAGVLADFFGSSTLLFYVLYASLNPQWASPAEDAFLSVTGLESTDYADVEKPWRFVDQGDWSVVDES